MGLQVNSATGQPVEEAVPGKNRGTGNGLLAVTEFQRAVCGTPGTGEKQQL